MQQGPLRENRALPEVTNFSLHVMQQYLLCKVFESSFALRDFCQCSIHSENYVFQGCLWCSSGLARSVSISEFSLFSLTALSEIYRPQQRTVEWSAFFRVPDSNWPSNMSGLSNISRCIAQISGEYAKFPCSKLLIWDNGGTVEEQDCLQPYYQQTHQSLPIFLMNLI